MITRTDRGRSPGTPRRSIRPPLVVLALVVAFVAACAPAPTGTAAPSGSGGPSTAPRPTPSAPGTGSRELYGFVPYWEMDEGMIEHVRTAPLTTVSLFSVTARRSGALAKTRRGYRAITGNTGTRIIAAAREGGARVELVFSSFGATRNERFFGDLERQDRAIAALVRLVGALGVDGVNVDVEAMPASLVPAYGLFVGRLREALRAVDPDAGVSVATQANRTGALMAAAATIGGADRIFMMGYDYRVNASWPGAVAPLDRRDGEDRDLEWSLDRYADAGVPADRLLLGLPLYGRTWPVTDAELGAPPTGRGKEWIPRRNLELLRNPAAIPVRDEIEVVEQYVVGPGGSPVPTGAAAPSPSDAVATPGASVPAGLRAIYVDSPATLEQKLALVDARGLAGGGFWAIGYERGLPGYTELMARFVAGEPMDGEGDPSE